MVCSTPRPGPPLTRCSPSWPPQVRAITMMNRHAWTASPVRKRCRAIRARRASATTMRSTRWAVPCWRQGNWASTTACRPRSWWCDFCTNGGALYPMTPSGLSKPEHLGQQQVMLRRPRGRRCGLVPVPHAVSALLLEPHGPYSAAMSLVMSMLWLSQPSRPSSSDPMTASGRSPQL